MAVVFPETADAALSTLGWQVVYRVLAQHDLLCVEPVFWDPSSPRPKSVHSGTDLGAFPLILLSLNFEGDFPQVLHMLQAAEVSLVARHRPHWPLVWAGGPVAFLNPFPVLPALDALWCGEAEAGFEDLVLGVARIWVRGGSKDAALELLAGHPGCFVPSRGTPTAVRQVAPVLSPPAHSLFVSSSARFANMFLMEVNRGCPYGCRFCAAGAIYRPPRGASVDSLRELVERYRPHKVGLVGTALTDWPHLEAFLHWIRQRRAQFSLSSVRADGLSDDFLQFLRKSGVRTITLALEGASTRLRRAMNKGLNEEALLRVVETMSRLRFETLKLYLIVGWPDETDADWAELQDLLHAIQDARRRGQGNRAAGLGVVHLSASVLVPKPWTALQWAPMASLAHMEAAFARVRAMVSPLRGVRFSGETPWQAVVQGYLARAGEEVFPLLVEAATHGWKQVLQAHGQTIALEVSRPRPLDSPLPWERLQVGVRRSYLQGQWEAYCQGRPSPPCPRVECRQCRRCGTEHLVEY